MEITKIISADICRDGGSYSFTFNSVDDSWYELFVQIKGIGSKEYNKPVIYRGGYNDGEIIEKLSWPEAREFLQSIKYKNPIFKELITLLRNNGIRNTENKSPLLMPVYVLWFYIKQYWKGNKSLASAFWGVGVLGNAINIGLILFIMNLKTPPLILVFAILFPPCFIFSLKSIWACSPNVKNKIWSDITRIIILIYLSFVAFHILGKT